MLQFGQLEEKRCLLLACFSAFKTFVRGKPPIYKPFVIVLLFYPVVEGMVMSS